MKNKCITLLTLLSLFLSRAAFAEPDYFDDQDDECFNRGKIVGPESNEYQKAVRRQRIKNWGLAFTTTALGIVTFIFVAQDHKK